MTDPQSHADDLARASGGAGHPTPPSTPTAPPPTLDVERIRARMVPVGHPLYLAQRRVLAAIEGEKKK